MHYSKIATISAALVAISQAAPVAQNAEAKKVDIPFENIRLGPQQFKPRTPFDPRRFQGKPKTSPGILPPPLDASFPPSRPEEPAAPPPTAPADKPEPPKKTGDGKFRCQAIGCEEGGKIKEGAIAKRSPEPKGGRGGRGGKKSKGEKAGDILSGAGDVLGAAADTAVLVDIAQGSTEKRSIIPPIPDVITDEELRKIFQELGTGQNAGALAKRIAPHEPLTMTKQQMKDVFDTIKDIFTKRDSGAFVEKRSPEPKGGRGGRGGKKSKGETAGDVLSGAGDILGAAADTAVLVETAQGVEKRSPKGGRGGRGGKKSKGETAGDVLSGAGDVLGAAADVAVLVDAAQGVEKRSPEPKGRRVPKPFGRKAGEVLSGAGDVLGAAADTAVLVDAAQGVEKRSPEPKGRRGGRKSKGDKIKDVAEGAGSVLDAASGAAVIGTVIADANAPQEDAAAVEKRAPRGGFGGIGRALGKAVDGAGAGASIADFFSSIFGKK